MTRLTDRQLECLQIMIDEDEEMLVEGIDCWVGGHLFRRSTLKALLLCLAVSDVSDSAGLSRYAVNGTGRAIRANPALAAEVYEAVLRQKPFTIVDGVIKEI